VTHEPTLRIGHSPDPDDAFMWYPLACDPNRTGPDGKPLVPKVETGGYRFIHVLEDIQSLNERSERAELEITALSIHQLPFIADRYALTSCGASMGDGYGPMVVAREPIALRELIAPRTTPGPRKRNRPRLAIPGERTSAWLALQLRLHEEGYDPGGDEPVDYEVVPFDQIIPAVAEGTFDAGLIIHEGQLTYANQGLVCILDLGKWWKDSRGLPLPLGGNAIRLDLGEAMPAISRVLLDSIEWALAHREEAVRFALDYARDMDDRLASEFVGMYVNRWTLDYGEAGRRAVGTFLDEAAALGLVPETGALTFIDPAPARGPG